MASDLVARPLAAVATIAEKNRWRARMYDFFTFGVDNQVGVFPTGRIDSGFDPSFGVYMFWNDIWRGSDVRARATSGGTTLWTANAQWRLRFAGHSLALVVEASRRPDRAFHGLGPESSRVPARYGERRFDARLRYGLRPLPDLALSTFIGHKWLVFEPDLTTTDQAALAEAIRVGRFAAPPALEGGLLALYAGVHAEYDTRSGRLMRAPRVAADYAHVRGTGFAVRGFIEQYAGLGETRAQVADPPRLPAWLSYGAGVTGTLDVTGTQRRLDLEVQVAFTEPLPDRPDVPFTEQVSLGGARPLRGFGDRRLVSRSAAVATLRYRWPVWSALDAILHYAVGNVFGPHLRGFEIPRLRASFGAGIATAAESDHPFEVLLAFGTEPFEAGGTIESTRLSIGTSVNF